jgi:hypothetical protein
VTVVDLLLRVIVLGVIVIAVTVMSARWRAVRRGFSQRRERWMRSSQAKGGSSLRLYIWISAWGAWRRNDLKMTPARRRDLHVPVKAGRWADDAL